MKGQNNSSWETFTLTINLNTNSTFTVAPPTFPLLSFLFSYNILTDTFVDPVLDPKYYGESCEYVYNGEWRKFTYDAFCEGLTYNAEEKNFRKPYNYHSYQFVVWTLVIYHSLQFNQFQFYVLV